MLPNKNRLAKSVEIEDVKSSGRAFRSKDFIVIVKKKPAGPSRFAFVVSTKISKSASIRNRIRRGMREAVRHELIYIKGNVDCVLIAKPTSAKLIMGDMMRQVKDLLKKANLL